MNDAGENEHRAGMYSYISPEQRVPADHPLRPLWHMTDESLNNCCRALTVVFVRGASLDCAGALLRALLFPVLYSVFSERMLMEQLQYNLLFRWFVGLNIDDKMCTFSKNRDHLLGGEIAPEFFNAVLELTRAKELLSDEHFTVDGTMGRRLGQLEKFSAERRSGARGHHDNLMTPVIQP